MHHFEPGVMQRGLQAFQERSLDPGFLHGCNLSATTRQELEADGTGTREKIQSTFTLQIREILQYIENIFAREIGGGTCRDVFRHIEAAFAVFSSYYSHNNINVQAKERSTGVGMWSAFSMRGNRLSPT